MRYNVVMVPSIDLHFLSKSYKLLSITKDSSVLKNK